MSSNRANASQTSSLNNITLYQFASHRNLIGTARRHQEVLFRKKDTIMAVDIFASENSASTLPSSTMNENYSGMTRQILEQRPQQQNNNSYNNSEQYFSYNNSWTVNSQPSSCVLAAYQPCYPTTTTVSTRSNSTVLLNMRTTQQQQQHSNSQSQVADSQSAVSDAARFLQEWSPTGVGGTYGSSYSTVPNTYSGGTYPWSKSTSVPQTSDSSTYSGRSQSHEGDEVACARSVTNAKRPRVTFTNKQIVELEKEFHYNK